MAADACSITTDRLFITDRVSNMRFLVDTGSDLCVLPRKHVPGRRERNSYDLFAANGTPTSDIGRLQILLYGCRPLYALAGSHSPAGHYGGDGRPSPDIWMDSSLRMPANHHHRPGPAVRIAAVPFPGQYLWHPSLPHDRFPSSRQRPRGTAASLSEGRHNVPGARTIDRRPFCRPRRHANSF